MPTREAEDTEPEISAERAHLAHSREALRRMRENVLSLDASAAGDWVSAKVLGADLAKRAEALRDDPTTALFFGRLDHPDERLYVGRRHVHDDGGRALVIDWRAPMARPFYKASTADPMGLVLRRRFGYSGGELTAFEDEDFSAPVESRLLIEEIERPRVGPMRDIVATIQPEQDDIVRADADHTLCVQGAPGTGKTAVGLHRVAYLLYAHRERMRRGGVLVIGPSASFLDYIRGVLPALGEVNVEQRTLDQVVATVPVTARDEPAAGRIKGDARMAEVLRRAVWSHLREPSEALVVPRGTRRWRIPAYEITELAEALRDRGVRYGAGRDLLGHRIAHAVLLRMETAGEACDDRTHEAVRRTRPVKAVVDHVWPALDPVRVVMRLLSDAEFLAQAADGLLDPAEQAALLWDRPPRGPKSARWTPSDAVLVDEAADLISRTSSLSHVVLDEAQDLSAMQCRAVGRRCETGSVTVLGDIAQGTTPWAVGDWSALLRHLGKPDADLTVLDRGYRVPRQIIDFASRLLPHIAPELTPPTSVRSAPGSLRVTPVADLFAAVEDACREALTGEGSVGLIAAEAAVAGLGEHLTARGLEHVRLADGMAGARLVLTPATQAKGLEFDQVIVVEPAAIVGAEPDGERSPGLRRLYVVLTRAVSRLTVLHARDLPDPLR
ncbi:HelD family protein [Actinoallomurus rhizosphaericola]|uniref:HelD family protein n=1 Tax=Actinoallomurus rhizosphaericola TaxID=2952536 RepID=UPI00209351CE|nr:AAA family ATPase [Actinoallomurus rhizosphaericola]MCO5998854.1 AAA family ATPase [Actinoallomurus rhizosphaericola]